MDLMENYWYIIAEASELGRKPMQLKRLGKTLVLWRDSNNKVQCIDDRCPHRGASLSLGKIKNDCITCPFHGIVFNGHGECEHIPFINSESVCDSLHSQSFQVTEHCGFIWLWYGESFPTEKPQVFSALEQGYPFHSMSRQWPTHYSRVIENQLDYFHLPFVHKRTIGRGFNMKSASNGSDRIDVTFENETISARMIKEGDGSSFHFIFPNSWQLRFSYFGFLFAAFCPVDDDNTVMYLRTYARSRWFKKVVTLFLQFSPLMNNIILKEDERVVLSQTPKAIKENMDEQLLALDKPIAIFRKHYFSKLTSTRLKKGKGNIRAIG